MTDAARTSWVEHTLDTLESAGCRRGGARSAVVWLLAGKDCAVTAREIDDELRGSEREVGRASVYRALEQLAGLGLVSRLDIGQGVARYEPQHPGGEHHHHLVCDECGSVTPFQDAELERSISRLSRRVPFRVAEHDVVLHGACDECG